MLVKLRIKTVPWHRKSVKLDMWFITDFNGNL